MKVRNDKAFKCMNCGRLTYPERVVCLGCGNREFESVPFTEKCKLLTFSKIHQLPWGMNDLFVTIGICQFDNGIKAMGRVSTPDVKIGDTLKARWGLIRQIKGEDVFGWIFEPFQRKKSVSR